MTTNPLLTHTLDIPFDQILPEHVEPAVTELIALSKSRLDAIGAFDGERTYENTVKPLDEATIELETVTSIVGHLESVVTTPELRAAYNAVQPAISAFYASIPLDPKLYAALSAYARTPEAKTISATKRRFLQKTLEEFKRHGAELNAEGKTQLEALSVKLADVTNKFAQNVVDASAAFELYVEDEKRLAGLPERTKAATRAAAEARGKPGHRFGLDAPTYLSVMTYADDAELRRTLWHAYNTRAASGERDNRPLIGEILALRAQKAKLLGYANFADLVLEDRMAKKGEVARAFVQRLEEKTQRAFEHERIALIRFRRELEGENVTSVSPWDVAYYAEKERRSLYDWDEEEIRPYLEASRVVDGVFEIAHRLYGIRITPKNSPVWHESVKCFGIHDADGADLGHFYVDLFPRETKRDGAWMGSFVTGALNEPHVGTICANLTPPSESTPALLSFREVETIFHEFGHLFHHMLSQVEVLSLAGTRVAWDFVELPSQIMENFCWEREGLDLFAKHYQSGALVPDAIFKKMSRAKNYRAGTDQMRQLGFASMDLAMHVDYSKEKNGDVMVYARELFQRFAPATLPDDYAMIASFGHLFSNPVGYAAAYYSYKWAEVLDADAFARFREEGVFNPKIGALFREHVLSKGDSADPFELFRAFRGRDPDPDALLARSGLLAEVAE